jgi:hypothetical protein
MRRVCNPWTIFQSRDPGINPRIKIDPCAAPRPPLQLALSKFDWRSGVPYIFGRQRRPTNSAAQWNSVAQTLIQISIANTL